MDYVEFVYKNMGIPKGNMHLIDASTGLILQIDGYKDIELPDPAINSAEVVEELLYREILSGKISIFTPLVIYCKEGSDIEYCDRTGVLRVEHISKQDMHAHNWKVYIQIDNVVETNSYYIGEPFARNAKRYEYKREKQEWDTSHDSFLEFLSRYPHLIYNTPLSSQELPAWMDNKEQYLLDVQGPVYQSDKVWYMVGYHSLQVLVDDIWKQVNIRGIKNNLPEDILQEINMVLQL